MPIAHLTAQCCRQIPRYRRRAFATTSRCWKGPFKVLFCGSDEYSVASLKAVLEAKDVWESVHVLTPPEQQIGRGGSKRYRPALLDFAEERGLTVSDVPSVIAASQSNPRAVKHTTWNFPAPFQGSDPSILLLTASFGHIIPNRLLAPFDPSHRLNVHPSLLPRWRGAAPVQWTIAKGDETTGVSVQRLVEKGKGIDAGDIVGCVKDLKVPDDARFETLLPVLGQVGGTLLVDVIRKIITGQDVPLVQDPSLVTRAPKINKNTARIQWETYSALDIDRRHRGFGHQEPLWCELHGMVVQLLDPRLVSSGTRPRYMVRKLEPGMVWLDKSPDGGSKRILVACKKGLSDAGSSEDSTVEVERVGYEDAGGQGDGGGDEGVGLIEVRMVKPAGKKEVQVKDWWNGVAKAASWLRFS